MGEQLEGQQETPPVEETPAAPPPEETAEAAAPAPVVEMKRGFLSRLNPLNFFRRESPEMYLREAESLVENQNLALATMAYQKAISLDDSRPDGYKGLGHVFLKKGGRTNAELALENFQEAVKRNPFDDQVFAYTAKIYEKLGKMKEATLERKKMMIVKTLQSDSKNPIANNNMGILLLQQGQTDRALEYFKKSIEANPTYDVALRNLATAYFKIATANQDEETRGEQIQKAKAYVVKALELTPTAPTMIIQGKIMIFESKFEEALALCEEAELIDAGNKGVFALKRIALEKLNRTQEAQQAFESFQALSK